MKITADREQCMGSGNCVFVSTAPYDSDAWRSGFVVTEGRVMLTLAAALDLG